VSGQQHRPLHLPQQSFQSPDVIDQAGQGNLRGPLASAPEAVVRVIVQAADGCHQAFDEVLK
jgi:hypothetical protein